MPPNFTTTLKTFARRALWLLVPLALLSTAWFAYAHWRISSQLARYKAAGQPTTLQDLVPPPIPDAENGRVVLAEMFATPLTPAEVDFVMGNNPPYETPKLPLSASEMALAEALITSRRSMLAAAERGHSTPRFVEDFDPQNPFGSGSTSTMGQMRQAAYVFSAIAHYHAQRGELPQALRMTDHTLLIAHWMGQKSSVFPHLAFIALHHKRANDLVHFAPELRLLGPSSPLGIERAELIRLINELLDDEPLLQSLLKAAPADRPLTEYSVRKMWPGLLMRPLADLQIARMNDATDALDAAARSNDTSFAIASRSGRSGPSEANADLFVHGPLGGEMGHLNRVYTLHLRTVAARHLAAAVLAVRLYELERGRLPTSLESLVPEYLPAVPVDVLTATRGPIRYDPVQRIVYSINLNNRDDGGRAPLAYGANTRESVPPGNDDIAYPLYRVTSPVRSASSTPATRPTTPPPPETAPAE